MAFAAWNQTRPGQIFNATLPCFCKNEQQRIGLTSAIMREYEYKGNDEAEPAKICQNYLIAKLAYDKMAILLVFMILAPLNSGFQMFTHFFTKLIGF